MLDQEIITQALTAIGDPTRLQIVFLLSRHERLNVTAIANHFQISRPTISHHLKILREAGLVEAERRGTWAYYRLNRAAVGELALALSP